MLWLLLLVVGVSVVLAHLGVPARVIVGAGVGLVVVSAAGLLPVVVVLVGVALAGWGLLRADRPQTPAAVGERAGADIGELPAVSGFAQTLADLQGRCALVAHRQGQGMVEDLESTLARLAGSGALTAEVRSELVGLTGRHLVRVHALTDALQAFLVRLAVEHGPLPATLLWLRLLGGRWQRWILEWQGDAADGRRGGSVRLCQGRQRHL